MQTLYGNNIEEYKNFLTKIYDYKTEIQELYLEKLIRKNAIMRKIWLSKLYDKDENCENILRHLEMEISSFISSRPLDFHKYEKLEGLY